MITYSRDGKISWGIFITQFALAERHEWGKRKKLSCFDELPLIHVCTCKLTSTETLRKK